MPSYTATQVKCPECGATLAVGEGATTTTCTYCGTSSRVQRRTQLLQRPMPLPPPLAHEPTLVARQVRSRVDTVVALTLGLIVFAAGAFLSHRAATHANSALDGIYWDCYAPAIGDIDRDGVADYVGFIRHLRANQVAIAAFSGTNGRELWRTPAIATKRTDVIALAGDAVLVPDELAHIDGYDRATGAHRWRVTAAEVVDAICETPTGAIVLAKDQTRWSIAATDGKLTATSEPCSGRNAPRGAEAFDVPIDRSPKVDGMSIGDVFQRGDGPMIAFGSKSPGTAVPMIAAFDGDRLLWRAEVPGHDPLGAEAYTTLPPAAVSDREVAITYRRRDTTTEIIVFERATGQRRFEVALSHNDRDHFGGVTIAPTQVAVARWGRLDVLDLASGKLLFAIGE